jgi:LysM repeat protein
MNKNLAFGIIGILVILCIAEAYGIIHERNAKIAVAMGIATQKQEMQKQGPPPGGKPMFTTKGMNLEGSAIAKYAYKIAPGDISAESQKVLIGFAVASKLNSDGSTTVTLTPKDSDDQFQTYTIKPGETLYFIEMTPADDNKDQDKDLNYRDDYGIITDSSGIIQ